MGWDLNRDTATVYGLIATSALPPRPEGVIGRMGICRDLHANAGIARVMISGVALPALIKGEVRQMPVRRDSNPGATLIQLTVAPHAIPEIPGRVEIGMWGNLDRDTRVIVAALAHPPEPRPS